MNDEITAEEIKSLIEKVKDKTVTPNEELQLLQFLNKGVEEMRLFIKEVMTLEE